MVSAPWTVVEMTPRTLEETSSEEGSTVVAITCGTILTPVWMMAGSGMNVGDVSLSFCIQEKCFGEPRACTLFPLSSTNITKLVLASASTQLLDSLIPQT
jgi:hypothetical protein